MNIQKLRFRLTNFKERKLFTFENYQLLYLDKYTYRERIDTSHIEEDISKLIPDIPLTKYNIKPFFCNITLPYEESQYKISELLCYIYASINSNFEIIKGKHNSFSKTHFWLDNGEIVYSPGLGIITSKEMFESEFRPITVIHNDEINSILKNYNPLDKFYQNSDPDFSINYINNIREEFNKNIEQTFEINDELKKWAREDYFAPMRSALTRQRKYLTKSSQILAHPDIPEDLTQDIE